MTAMQTTFDRRSFIKTSTAGSAGLMFIPSMLSASANPEYISAVSKGSMSGLTPISVLENACMLAFCSDKLSQESENAITTDIHLRDTPGNKGRLAVLLPPNNDKILELLDLVKNGNELKYPLEKRAIAFGWAAVNAVEKNINKFIKAESPEDFTRVRMHQDAIVINGFSRAYDVAGANKEEVEALLNSLLTRTITRIHTLKPDSDDGIGWVNRMAAWRKQNVKAMSELASAIVRPDRQQAGQNFYKEEEKIIQAATDLQNGRLVRPDEIGNSLNESPESQYALALKEATIHILLMDSYLTGGVSRSELKSKLLS